MSVTLTNSHYLSFTYLLIDDLKLFLFDFVSILKWSLFIET